MGHFKNLIFALMVGAGFVVSFFFIANLICTAFGLAYFFTLFQSFAVFVTLFVARIFFFIVTLPPAKPDSIDCEAELEELRKENLHLRELAVGCRIILAAIIKYQNGEVKFPRYMVENIDSDNIQFEVEHEEETGLEIFKIKE